MRIATYGSLRKDQHNYHRIRKECGEEPFEYIKTLTIPGFALYDLGSYPAAVNDLEDDVTPLVVEVFEASEEAYRKINRMETESGYVAVTLTLEDQPTTMWVYPYVPAGGMFVPLGDWVAHLEARKSHTENSRSS